MPVKEITSQTHKAEYCGPFSAFHPRKAPSEEASSGKTRGGRHTVGKGFCLLDTSQMGWASLGESGLSSTKAEKASKRGKKCTLAGMRQVEESDSVPSQHYSWIPGLGVPNHSLLVKFTGGFHPCDFTIEVNEQMAPKQQRASWRCPLDYPSMGAIFPSRAWPINNMGSTFLYRLLLKARLET